MSSNLRLLKIPPGSQTTAFPSPARSESDSLGYNSALYSFPAAPSTPLLQHSASFFPPSPMSSAPWTPQAPNCTTPLMPTTPVDLWTQQYNNHHPLSHMASVPQDAVPWDQSTTALHYGPAVSYQARTGTPMSRQRTHRSSVSSSNDASISSRDGSEPFIKREPDPDWTPHFPFHQTMLAQPQPQPLTVSPRSLSAVRLSPYTQGESSAYHESIHRSGSEAGLGISTLEDSKTINPRDMTDHPGSSAGGSSTGRQRGRARPKEPTDHFCELCGEYFQRHYNLRKHKENLHGNPEKKHGCSACEMKFGRKADAERHYQSVCTPCWTSCFFFL